MINTVTVAGLGLIGASIAKAIGKYTNCDVYGWNRTKSVIENAIKDKTIINEASNEILGQTDLLIVCLYPKATIDYIINTIPKLKKGAIIIDICGVKTSLINEIDDIAKEAGVVFIGGHPMAGLAVAGYENSFAELYQDASMILVPTKTSNDSYISKMSEFFSSIGFTTIIVCTKEEHDSMIAYTSQLAHIISCAFVKSPKCKNHKGFSGGSYKDMTRVATLNEHVWTELFSLNRDAILEEIDVFSKNLNDLREAIACENEVHLKSLLSDGRIQKEKYR